MKGRKIVGIIMLVGLFIIPLVNAVINGGLWPTIMAYLITATIIGFIGLAVYLITDPWKL